MRAHRYSKFFLFLLSATLLTAVLPAFGQEEPAEPAAEEPAGLTQGQAAMLIARRLGLLNSTSAAYTQAAAIQLLSARGVAPKNGWDAEALLTPGELARLLVQALGLEAELSEAQIAGDDAQPYIDLLIEKFGVDVSQIGTAGAAAGTVPGATGMDDPMADAQKDPLSSSPLTGPGVGGSEVTPVSQKDLQETLNAIGAGGAGGTGTGGTGSGGAGNVTPSAP